MASAAVTTRWNFVPMTNARGWSSTACVNLLKRQTLERGLSTCGRLWRYRGAHARRCGDARREGRRERPVRVAAGAFLPRSCLSYSSDFGRPTVRRPEVTVASDWGSPSCSISWSSMVAASTPRARVPGRARHSRCAFPPPFRCSLPNRPARPSRLRSQRAHRGSRPSSSCRLSGSPQQAFQPDCQSWWLIG
jgi:hypothetical protein